MANPKSQSIKKACSVTTRNASGEQTVTHAKLAHLCFVGSNMATLTLAEYRRIIMTLAGGSFRAKPLVLTRESHAQRA